MTSAGGSRVPRVGKVERLAREVLGEAIQGLKDPRVGFATVTAVRMTPDLRRARVLVSVMGTEEERGTTMAALARATPHLRSELGRQVRLRFLPELTFELDEAEQRVQRVQELLGRIRDEGGAEGGP